MTAWQDFSRADFDARLADKRAARAAREAAAAGQAGLFYVATPERDRKAPATPEQLDGQASMFGDLAMPRFTSPDDDFDGIQSDTFCAPSAQQLEAEEIRRECAAELRMRAARDLADEFGNDVSEWMV